MSKKDQAHAHRWQNRVHNWLIMPQCSAPSKLRPVTVDELAKRKVGAGSANKEMWMAINGMVYDVTRFTQFHPGGVLLMQKYSGMDATVVYDKNHTNVPPEDVIGNYKIGPLVPNPTAGGEKEKSSSSSKEKSSSSREKTSSSSSKAAAAAAAASSANTLGVPASSSSHHGASSLSPPPNYATAAAASSSLNPKAINGATLRYPPAGSSASTMPPPYVRQPYKNPSSSVALLEPLEDVVSAARNSRLFDSVPDDQLTAAAAASRNERRAKRDSRDPQTAHGAVDGTPSDEVLREEAADDVASIECVFDLLDAEAKGYIRMDQLEAFLVNIGGFPDAKTAKEAVRDTLNAMPTIKSTGRITKPQFVEIANSL